MIEMIMLHIPWSSPYRAKCHPFIFMLCVSSVRLGKLSPVPLQSWAFVIQYVVPESGSWDTIVARGWIVNSKQKRCRWNLGMDVPQLDQVNFVQIMGWNQRNTIGALGKTQKKSNQYILQLAGIGPPSGFFFRG